jgi:hypothetical protein
VQKAEQPDARDTADEVPEGQVEPEDEARRGQRHEHDERQHEKLDADRGALRQRGAPSTTGIGEEQLEAARLLLPREDAGPEPMPSAIARSGSTMLKSSVSTNPLPLVRSTAPRPKNPFTASGRFWMTSSMSAEPPIDG